MTPHRAMAFWLALALSLPPLATGQAGPDELAEAARLAAHAQTLEDQCRYRESSEWLAQAIDRLKRFRSTDVSQTRAAGSLLAQLEVRRRDVREQPGLLDRQEQQIAGMLTAARAESAGRLLRENVAPACDSRFTRLEEEVARRQAAARSLVRQGEESVRRYDKKAAIGFFERAAATDAEVPGLAEGLQAARALAGSHKARNLLVAILVAGALGAGGYYAQRKYGENPAAVSHR